MIGCNTGPVRGPKPDTARFIQSTNCKLHKWSLVTDEQLKVTEENVECKE